jgi:hypothetical protein
VVVKAERRLEFWTVERDRTGPRGRKVGGSVRANCPGVCQSRPSDSPRSLSPVWSVLARALGGSDVDEDGAQVQEQGREGRNRESTSWKGEAVRCRRRTGRPHTVLYMYRRCKYRPREGAVAGWGLARRPLKPPVLQWQAAEDTGAAAAPAER